jgi:hypothetical protein
MIHLAFEYLPALSGVLLALLGLRPTWFRLFQFGAACICVGTACALVAGELVGETNVVLACIARDSAAAAVGNAALFLITKGLTSGGKAYDRKES